jgi:hypothetical protein
MNSVPQTEYGMNNQLIPRYKYIKFPPTNVSQAIFNPTNTNLIQFRIPALSTINLAKSYIQYNFSIPAGGVNNWTVLSETGCDFTSVQLQPSTALNIVDLNFAHKFVHIMQPYRSKLAQDFLSGANDIMSKNRCGLQPAQNNIQIASQDGLTTLPGVWAGAQGILDRQQLSFSSQPNTAVSVNRKVPLDCFVNTLLALNKDLHFPCDLYLNLTLLPLFNVFTYTTTPQTPTNAATQTLPAASITCTSFNLYVAIETNENITKSLIADINKGPMKIPIPFTYNSLQITPSSVSQSSASFIVSKNNGRQLNGIGVSFWNINSNSLLCYDCSNVQGRFVSSYSTYLDSTNLQQGQQNVFNPNASYSVSIFSQVPYTYGDDYMINHEWIKGSCILNYPGFQQTWLHQDLFGIQSFEDESQQQNNQWWCSEMSGLSLLQPSAGDHLYSITFNCPGTNPATVAATNSQGSQQLYTSFFSRFLTIDASGIYLSS